jgi:hypothetical protein
MTALPRRHGSLRLAIADGHAANLVDPGIGGNEPEDVPEDVIHVGDLADILADVGIEDADLLAVHVFGDRCQA